MVSRASPGYQVEPRSNRTVGRIEFLMLPTLITDRFGNWVRYTYGGSDGLRVTRIDSSDGRAITFSYSGWGNRVQSINDGSRTWTYDYDGSGALSAVTLPDGSQWHFALSDLEREPPPAPDRACGTVWVYQWDDAYHGGSITHPSGAQGVFSVKMTAHGRTRVPGSEEGCEGATTPGNVANLVSRYFNNYALVNKTLSGPGMPAMAWNYAYSEAIGRFEQETQFSGTKTVTVADPHRHAVQKTFGTAFGTTEGLLLTNVVVANGNPTAQTTPTVLQTTSYSYAAPNEGPFSSYLGYTTTRADVMSTVHTPQRERVITQQGVTMTQTVTGFDIYARALGVRRYSTLGPDRTESTVYHNNRSLWVLDQVESRTIAGILASSTSYNAATALPETSFKFGKLQATYGFHNDGTLASIRDGLNHTTSFGDYMRGLPRRITYADNTYTTADVNNIGAITSVTNEANTTWHYGYDAMGRLALKTPPSGDPVNYHATTLTFEPVFGNEFDLEPGHWRQTITTGNAVTVNYFDARWRKRVTATYDAANRAATTRVQRFDYDAYNKTTFASYPLSGLASIYSAVPGTTTTYDALGRPTLTVADSELGPLSTTTDYISGFQTRTTNPRGFATTQAFQVFDAPSQDHLVTAWLLEGATVSIARDDLGTPVSITRGGGGKSGMRRYVYDSYRQLCKTVEPETGATLLGYDAVGNLTWRVSGQPFPGPGCETSVVDSLMIKHGYDARNRLTSTTYGDGSPGISRSYTADGLVAEITTQHPNIPVAWAYTYNNRRLPTRERYTWGDPNNGWNFDWTVDAYGHAASLTDLWGTVNYAPNALGQPTQASGFASGVTYHASGAVAGYTLDNGVSYNMGENTRGLPEWWTYSGVSNDRYLYDANGNVASITDHHEGGAASRSMPLYDGLDRLRQASGPWGSASFDYDGLDNLTASTVSSRTLSHNIDAATNRLTSLSGSQNIGIGYDANGNVTQRGAQSFTFDLGNRMTAAGGKVNNILYDGHGRRNLVWFADGGWMHQAYTQDGKLRFAWRNSHGGTRYVYLGDKLIAEHTEGGVKTFAHADALGSPTAKTNNNGGLVSRTRYEPYGATVAGSTNPVKVGFTGHVNDPETGLVYMQQRYYDPVAGRFLSVDPVTPDANTGSAFGRYHYAENNPYKYTDPDGRQASSGGGFGFGWETVSGGPAVQHPIVPVLRDIVAGASAALPSAPTVTTGTATATTVSVTVVEVTKTSNAGGGGSTFVGIRSTPALPVQTSLQTQAKIGETGGLTIKASASAGWGAAGVNGNISASLGTSGPGLQVSGGGVGAANEKGGIMGVRPPAVAIGYTWKY